MTPGMAIAGATAWTSPSEAGVAIAVPPSFGGAASGPKTSPIANREVAPRFTDHPPEGRQSPIRTISALMPAWECSRTRIDPVTGGSNTMPTLANQRELASEDAATLHFDAATTPPWHISGRSNRASES